MCVYILSVSRAASADSPAPVLVKRTVLDVPAARAELRAIAAQLLTLIAEADAALAQREPPANDEAPLPAAQAAAMEAALPSDYVAKSLGNRDQAFTSALCNGDDHN